VASSAGCVYFAPAAAVAVGLAAGALVVLAVEFFELRMAIDDPGGVISVHAIGGIWGLFAAGLFAKAPTLSAVIDGASAPSQLPVMNLSGQWMAQLTGIATLLGFVLVSAYSLNWILNRIYPQRVSREGERQGMDLHELGAGAYPEFVTHTDEFSKFLR